MDVEPRVKSMSGSPKSSSSSCSVKTSQSWSADWMAASRAHQSATSLGSIGRQQKTPSLLIGTTLGRRDGGRNGLFRVTRHSGPGGTDAELVALGVGHHHIVIAGIEIVPNERGSELG